MQKNISFTVTELRDKITIESFFRKNSCLFVYQIGDLDDFFFEKIRWFALTDNGKILQIAMIYYGGNLPVILAITDDSIDEMRMLIKEIIHELPEKLYSHLTPGIFSEFEKKYNCTIHGAEYKMCLQKNNLKIFPDLQRIRRLHTDDHNILKGFYDENYPDNWFDKRMLETEKYFGYFEENELAGVAGIHVYSEKFRVAALGNIVTAKEFRGQSICKKVTSALCKDLFETVDIIGLNVDKRNLPALSCYTSLGFKIAGEYEEYMLERK